MFLFARGSIFGLFYSTQKSLNEFFCFVLALGQKVDENWLKVFQTRKDGNGEINPHKEGSSSFLWGGGWLGGARFVFFSGVLPFPALIGGGWGDAYQWVPQFVVSFYFFIPSFCAKHRPVLAALA